MQTATAAGLVYFLATFVLGNKQDFFAPSVAVIALGLSVGQRGRRAFEVAIGVAVGLAVADLIVLVIGVGALQIAVVVALAALVMLVGLWPGPLVALSQTAAAVLSGGSG